MAYLSYSFRPLACLATFAALVCCSSLAGQVLLTTPSAFVERGGTVHFYAAREDGQATSWLWEVENALDGLRRRTHPAAGGRGHISIETNPWWDHQPRIIRVTARDAREPEAKAELSVTLVPAMLTLTAPETLESEDQCDILATRVDGKAPACRWRLLDSKGGRIQGEAGTGRYEAPAVTAPATFHVRAIDEEGFQAVTSVRVLPRAVLRLGTPHLISGNQSTLSALRRDGKATDWAYGVQEDQGGVITAGPEGTLLYTAPVVTVPVTFTLQAQDRNSPRDLATAQVHVIPRAVPCRGEAPEDSYDYLFQTILPRTLEEPLVPVPAASLFAGGLEPPDHPWSTKPFNGVKAIVFVEKDPAMGPLQREWLVGDQHGIDRVSALGKITPLVKLTAGITALAARQPGTTQGHPFRVVFGSWAEGNRAIGHVGAVMQDGRICILAGNTYALSPPGKDGPARQATFGVIRALATGVDGTVYVADDERLRSISPLSPLGQVSTLARLGPTGLVPKPHAGSEALSPLQGHTSASDGDYSLPESQFPILGLALDQATGELYLSHGGGIHKWTPGEQPSVVLGPKRPDFGGHSGLAIHGRQLFIPDPVLQMVRVFNLDTQTLSVLVGDKHQDGTRMGPLGPFSPSLSPGDCAALEEPTAIWVNGEGTCMVGCPWGLVHLELGAFTVEERAETEEPGISE